MNMLCWFLVQYMFLNHKYVSEGSIMMGLRQMSPIYTREPLLTVNSVCVHSVGMNM